MTDLPFEPPTAELGPEQLMEIAARVGKCPDLWDADLHRTPEDRTYTDVFTNEHVGVWAISWVAEQHDTGYHDHDVCGGAVYVVTGAIRHEHLRLGQHPVGSAVRAGEGFCFDNTFIHRMRAEPGAGPTITIHAYSPPLVRTGQYGELADGLLHRVPSPAGEQLRPLGYQGPPTTD